MVAGTGGLAVRDLHHTSITLRVRWLWLQSTDPERPWGHLQLPSDEETRQFFRVSTTWTVSDGKTCHLWCDHWIEGASIAEIASALILLVPRWRLRQRLVCDALHDCLWIRDIHGALNPAVVIWYIDLWRRIQLVQLRAEPGIIDWKWTNNGVYTTSSADKTLFLESGARDLGPPACPVCLLHDHLS